MTATSDIALEILAGTPPGGGQDRAARALAVALGGDISITNLAGRGGGNAWDALVERAGDPTVVSISSPTLITNRELGIAAIDERDVTPLALLCTEALAFCVTADAGDATARDLVNRLATGGAVSAIATERGNVNHIALGRVVRAGGGEPSSAPVRVFDSARHAIADTLEGRSEVAVVSAASTLPELETGEIRVLAVSAAERMSAPFESVPTWTELGVDCVIGTWRGVVGPPGLVGEAIEAWESALAAAVATDVWADALRRHHWVDTYLVRRGYERFLEVERARLVAGLADLGLAGGIDG